LVGCADSLVEPELLGVLPVAVDDGAAETRKGRLSHYHSAPPLSVNADCQSLCIGLATSRRNALN